MSLLVRHASPELGELALEARLPGTMRGVYGALPAGPALEAVIARARLAG